MEGYDVLTTDDDKVGHVVERRDGFLIVESGHLLKHKHAVPEQLAHESDGVVRLTVSKELVDDSPRVDHDFDALAVSRYYGLVEDDTRAESDLGAEEEGERHGVEAAERERAEIREHLEGTAGEDAGAAPRPASYSRSAGQRLERP